MAPVAQNTSRARKTEMNPSESGIGGDISPGTKNPFKVESGLTGLSRKVFTSSSLKYFTYQYIKRLKGIRFITVGLSQSVFLLLITVNTPLVTYFERTVISENVILFLFLSCFSSPFFFPIQQFLPPEFSLPVFLRLNSRTIPTCRHPRSKRFLYTGFPCHTIIGIRVTSGHRYGGRRRRHHSTNPTAGDARIQIVVTSRYHGPW